MITDIIETRTFPPHRTQDILGMNQGMNGEKPATNNTRYGTTEQWPPPCTLADIRGLEL